MDRSSVSYVPDSLWPPRPARVLTLADVRPGDTVRVRAVAPSVRELLAGLGVRESAWVRCESVDRYVVVRTVDGCVPFERGLLTAVEVSPIETAADVAPAAAHGARPSAAPRLDAPPPPAA